MKQYLQNVFILEYILGLLKSSKGWFKNSLDILRLI